MTETVKKSILPSSDEMGRVYRIQQVSSGQLIVSLPGAICDAIGWKKGTAVQFRIADGRLYIEKAD